jgi:hypothetical protein
MRTKTLLLTAALSAAGIATSMAQVFSVNAVGYVNTTVEPGYSIISNPLTAANNTIAELFKGVPAGTQIYKYNGAAGFAIATYDVDEGGFTPADVAAQTVLPGEGVFIRNPGPGNLTITFVGEVPQGDLKNPLPAGLSIKSSMVPQAGTAKELGLVGSAGDQVYQYDTQTGYYISTFDVDEGDWTPALKPLAVGEAFFLRKVAAGSWDRTFSVNQ